MKLNMYISTVRKKSLYGIISLRSYMPPWHMAQPKDSFKPVICLHNIYSHIMSSQYCI